MNVICRRLVFMFELFFVYELVIELRFDRLIGWLMKNKKLIVKF